MIRWKMVSTSVVAIGMLCGCAGPDRQALQGIRQLVDHHARIRSTLMHSASAEAGDSETPERTARFTGLSVGGSRDLDPGAGWLTRPTLADVVFPDDDTGPSAGARRDRPGPLPGFWDTVARDFRNMPGDLWEDTKAVYTSGPNLVILGLTYGGSLALQTTGPDDTIEDSLRGKNIFKDDVNDALGALGNPATHFGLAGLWYLVGQQRQDDKTYEVGRTLFSALIVNGLSTVAGKLASWDNSPNGEYFAFPSGHTSSSFTVASVLHEAYGPWVGTPLYALSTLVAVERLDDEEHYFSDVIMGGVLGLVIGHTVAGHRDIEFLGGRIVPYADPAMGSTGIAWHKEF